MRVQLDLTVHDWERLYGMAFQWDAEFANDIRRFENYTQPGQSSTPARPDWAWAYDVGSEWTGVIFARAYLRGLGLEHEVVWDMDAQGGPTHLILCNLVPRGFEKGREQDG